MKKMNKRVGYFTDDKLKELSEQPNTVVMQPTYDTVFEPWPSAKVSSIMDRVVEITNANKNKTPEEIQNICKNADKNIEDFAHKYQIMFKKLTEPAFVEDEKNIKVIKQMILLKCAVDKNMTSVEAAQAEASDLAMKSLVERVKSQKK